MALLKSFFTPRRWEGYRDFFQIIIFKYFVLWFSLVPIFGGITNGLPKEIQILENQYSISLTLPFNWHILWLSSLLFVLSLIIYYAFSPNFIRKYNTFSDYQSYSHSPRWIIWELSFLLKEIKPTQKKKLLERLSTKKFIKEVDKGLEDKDTNEPIVEEGATKLIFLFDNKYYEIKSRVKDDEYVKELFYEIYGRYSSNNEIARGLILYLLFGSGLLFLYVLLQHIWSGTKFVFNIC